MIILKVSVSRAQHAIKEPMYETIQFAAEIKAHKNVTNKEVHTPYLTVTVCQIKYVVHTVGGGNKIKNINATFTLT